MISTPHPTTGRISVKRPPPTIPRQFTGHARNTASAATATRGNTADTHLYCYCLNSDWTSTHLKDCNLIIVYMNTQPLYMHMYIATIMFCIGSILCMQSAVSPWPSAKTFHSRVHYSHSPSPITQHQYVILTWYHSGHQIWSAFCLPHQYLLHDQQVVLVSTAVYRPWW